MKYALLLVSVSFLTFACSNAEEQPAQEKLTFEQAESDSTAYSQTVENATFPSKDSLLISAKVYGANPSYPTILLCHQARYNKSEYDGIAERLQQSGFNCIAIDQRSGGPIGAVQNETYNRAIAKDLPTDYVDAQQDIEAALEFAKTRFNTPVILWGSSYSSTLALYIGAENTTVQAVVSFSPGDYLADDKGSLVPIMETFAKPYFITSSRSEGKGVAALLPESKKEHQVVFTPQGPGHHGSRALWINQSGGEEYWEAIEEYLSAMLAVLK